MRELLLESIRMDGGTQSRERIDEPTVTEYAEDMKKTGNWSPVTIFHDGTDYWLADGFHRVLAAQRAGKRTIRGDIKKGTKTDAIWHACGVNCAHGLRRKNEDKRKSVKMALSVHADRSDRFIAEHCKVSDQLVATVRREMTPQLRDHAVETRTGIDGKARKIPPPPDGEQTERTQRQEDKPKKIPPPPSGETVSSGQSTVGSKINPHPSPLPSQGEGEKRGGKTPQERLDKVKKPIPDHLWPLWDRGSEIAEMAATVTRMAGLIRRMHNEGDLVILDGNGQAIVTALETAKQGLNANIPFAVCPYCKGTLSDGCRFCKGRGIVGNFQYKHVPQELK